MRFIVRSTPAAEPLVKGLDDVDKLINGEVFVMGGRTWTFKDYGRFATIATETATAPFVAIVIPPAFAKMRAVEIGRDLDRGVTPSDGVYRRPGVLPSEGGGVAVAA